jgi:hypothetical protein
LFQILDERHLQIWLTDSSGSASGLLAEHSWNGAIRQASSDYLLVVDTNMGYNKANAVVEERLDYRVVLFADQTAQATLTLQYANRSKGDQPCDPHPRYGADYDDLINRCYWDYLRLYVPEGSQLRAATAHATSAELVITGEEQSGTVEILPRESGKAVFGSFFVLDHGQEIAKTFVYELPPGTVEETDNGWRYRLLVQKQAGTDARPLRVTVALPPGTAVESVAAEGTGQANPTVRQPEPNVVTFNSNLETDCWFEIQFRYND